MKYMSKGKKQEINKYFAALINKRTFHIHYCAELQEHELLFLSIESERFESNPIKFQPVYFFGNQSKYSQAVREFIYRADGNHDTTYIVCTKGIPPEELPYEKLLDGLKWVEMLERCAKMGFPETSFIKNLP